MSGRRDPELEFLPAALEIAETPPLPAARWLLWSIVLCAVVAATWSAIGRVDIVGIAPGRVVATGRTKLVQAHATAVIARLHVREGQRVAAGELLVELDATAARSSSPRRRPSRRPRICASSPTLMRRHRPFTHAPPSSSICSSPNTVPRSRASTTSGARRRRHARPRSRASRSSRARCR